MKMAGVFMISSCTLALRTGIFPRWMAYLRLLAQGLSNHEIAAQMLASSAI